MGGAIKLAGITARPSSILIDLRAAGLKQVTYAIAPTPKNLAYAARLRLEIIAKHRTGTLRIEDYFPHLRQTADTFDTWADTWLQIVTPNLAATTLKEYKNSLSRFREAWGNRRLTEIDRLLDASGDWRNYFEAAIYSGLRPSEQIALRWADVDLVEKTLTVRAARVRGIEKGIKTATVRTVRLPQRALAAIKRQRAISGMLERVFIHPVSRAGFADTQPPSDAWKRISKLAGIRARDARQTRHTYATLMLLAGAKPAFVSRQMGHANSQMFFKTYSKWLDSEDDWREVRKLDVTNNVTTTRKPA